MPDTMSREKKVNGSLWCTNNINDGAKGMAGSVELAKIGQGNNYFMPNQFGNEYNLLAHYETTAIEILEDTDES